MSEQEKKQNQKQNEDDEWYTYKVIKGVTYKYLKNIPYRFGVKLSKLMAEYIKEDGTYDLSKWDIEKIIEIVLCNMVVEPKLDKAYLYSDKCSINVFTLGNMLAKQVLSSNDIKDITGVSFGDDENEEDKEEEIQSLDEIIKDIE